MNYFFGRTAVIMPRAINTFGAILFCFFTLVQDGRGQSFVHLVKPKLYATNVADYVREKFLDYGLSNLPVVDYSIYYNTSTSIVQELIGYVYYNEGFVISMKMELDEQRIVDSVYDEKQSASISSTIIVDDIHVLLDFHADLTVQPTEGTVIVTPGLFKYAVKVDKNLTDNKVKTAVSMESYMEGKDLWNFHPDNIVTLNIRRHYQENKKSTSVLIETLNAWIPLIKEFLDEAVKKFEFPAIEL